MHFETVNDTKYKTEFKEKKLLILANWEFEEIENHLLIVLSFPSNMVGIGTFGNKA
jgi:hypothetical protein